MRIFLAAALLVLAVAEAHHTAEHTLRGARFSTGIVHIYDVEVNVTSGVLGLSNQVSKSALKAELHVYAKSEKEHVLKITKVHSSGSVKAAESKDADVPMEKNRELEDKLSTPIKFTLENGKVTSYSLSPDETLESRKIKKSILRSLEMHVPEDALQKIESSSLHTPVTYNITKDLGLGEHTTHYIITVSPNVDYPYSENVYNISKSENFEGERYHSHKFHHNFRRQGCSDVCKKERTGQPGCPFGYEPHQSPVKTYVHYQHHLALEFGVMTPEIIKVTEVHVAKMYDQDMEVLIRHSIRKIGHNKKAIEEPAGETTHTDLEEHDPEINEKEINAKCHNKTPREATEAAKALLKQIARIIARGDLETKESTMVGEKIILLKNALSKLRASDLKQVASDIIRKGSIKAASEEEKLKRQIWIDILPVIGTPESVTFIVNYIKESIERELFVWEAKEMLESLPQNIHIPSERNIRELRELLSLPKTRSSHLLHSAAYSCIAKVISSMCNGTESESKATVMQSHWHRKQDAPRSMEHSTTYNPVDCPVQLVSEIIKETSDMLKRTKKHDEIIIYIETLARTGVKDALPVISEYAQGIAENIQEFSPSYIEFVKSAALYSLHTIASRHPDNVLSIVKPIYFNETESPKIRTAAFGVLIRSQPSLETLQHVAIRSWTEQSNEVGSYVTSSLDSFGNSTLPCMQTTVHRIKQVMPMVRRFDIGIQHAKNILWSSFDDIRMFGLKGRLSYTPNNASIIPNNIYHALSYSTDSLEDTIIQSSLNIEGLTQRKVFQYIDEHILGISPIENIPPSKENEIFEEAKVVERIPDTLRFTIYKRMFYSSSYYYLDMNNLRPQLDTLKEYLEAYLKKTSFDYAGTLVKVILPSYFHTVTIAKTLPYPVEFQMHQPIVLALKVESKERSPTLPNFHLLVKPSVYITKLFTNQMKNIEDCKEVGVYHENKIAISYPVLVKFRVEGSINLTVSYKLPELPKKVLYYFTESGTFAGKKTLETLPSSEDRRPIRTLPSPFKNSQTIHFPGIPVVQIESHTEEISLVAEDMPKTPMEILDFAAKRLQNAGWRYKALNLTIDENSKLWPKNTEATFNIYYKRTHDAKRVLKTDREQMSASWFTTEGISDGEWMAAETTEQDPESTTENLQKWWWNRKEEDGDWTHDLRSDDIPHNKNPTIFANQGKRASLKVHIMPHVYHLLQVQMETRPVHTKAFISFSYNHTHDGVLHAAIIDAALKTANDRDERWISIDNLMGFLGKPDEFHYDTHTDNNIATFVSALRCSPGYTEPWRNVDLVVKGAFGYEPLDSLLNSELEDDVDRTYFLSEEHDQCIQDVRNGHPLSTNCVRAMRERSIYNNLNVTIVWDKEPPKFVKNIARTVDTYLKHIYYDHMSVDYEQHYPKKIQVYLNHINKLTDEPVFDVRIEKPDETLTFRRMKAVDDPLSSVHDLTGVDIMALTNNTYPPTCVMMEKYIKTYDLKSYPLTLDRCSYVLSAHCSDYKNFAIIAKILSPDGTKEIHMHIGQNTLVLSPKSGKHYTVKYGGQEYSVFDPIVFGEESGEIYAYIERYGSRLDHEHLIVVARRAGVTVTYTEKNVKVQIHPRYKGETCGLCSEFDGEIIREFRGMDKCLYSHADDFANSAIINRQTCRKEPLHPYVCEQEISMVARKGVHEKEPTIKRNVVVVKGDEICFSVRAVPVCEANAKPTKTEPLLLGFHCLPKEDVTARRMVSEAKRRSLGEIENKSVDYENNVPIAKMCPK